MATSIEIPKISIGDIEIPQFGLGVFQVPPDETVENVTTAFEAGYRHIDTAAAYGNEVEVGKAVHASGIAREELFITTKLWNDEQHRARAALEASLERLGLDYVDLYLIHWPAPAQDRYVKTWQALIEAREAGLARAIGVSNFQPAHLRRIVDETGETPAVNQIELHPYLVQAELRREHAERGIVTEAWSPLAKAKATKDPVVAEISSAHDKTPGQVVLRWHIQLGNVVFPKSMSPERLRQNIDVFDFELSEDEMGRIEALDRGERTGPNPDTFG